MDMLFSPYGFGSVPKSVMVEVEKRTGDLLKSSSFQRMLELEKKHKIERLRGAQPLLPSSQFPAQLKEGPPPPRPERPDSLFPHEQFLMVRAAPRPVIPPSLSITIPQSTDHERRAQSDEGEAEQEEEEDTDIGTPTNNEPSQKQVKFLAPEDSEDDEDGMSEQSSICQSPSWEGYGQRKKEKKQEAERRKREKEQAEKEAKAARRRNTARLSKPPPPPAATPSRDYRAVGLTNADRSMSDPLLISRPLLQSTRSIQRPEDVGRAVSADDVQQSRRPRIAVADVLSGSGSNPRHAGGGIAENAATRHHLLNDSHFVPRQDLHRSMSEGQAPVDHQPPAVPSFRHDSRSPRDAFPPSASRTPVLRHMSPSGGNRTKNLFEGPANVNQLQESLSAAAAADEARQRGYVVHQRAQAAERAMAGLADEQLVGSVAQNYPPSASSSRPAQHTRRSSLTQEAKSAAMKLVGKRTSSAARDDGPSQNDYLTFKAIPYSASATDASSSVGSMPTTPRSVNGSFPAHLERLPTSESSMLRSTKGLQESSTALERPFRSQSSLSSSGPSVTGSDPSSHGKKNRSLKDAAKAALSISKGSQKIDNSKPSISIPPYLALRSRMHSGTSNSTEKSRPPADEDVSVCYPPLYSRRQIANRFQKATTATLVSDQAKPSEMRPPGGYRVSEGSSSSSAYEGGSPLPSPTTTPDTSRPQSAKGVPLTARDVPGENTEAFGLQDDERTLRQSLDSSKSSTPRIVDSEDRGNIEIGNDDRWSRTALPIDIDCDAQSFITTVSYLDNVDGTEQVLPSADAKEQLEPLKQAYKSMRYAKDVELAVSIPPRSRKREQMTPERTTEPLAAPPLSPKRHRDAGVPKYMVERSEEHEGTRKIGASEDHARSLERGGAKREAMPKTDRKHQQKLARPEELDKVSTELRKEVDEDEVQAATAVPQRDWVSASVSSASSTAPPSQHAFTPDFQLPSNPYFADFPEPLKHHGVLSEIPTSVGPPSPVSLPSPLRTVPSKPAAQPRTNSAPTPLSASTNPSSRSSTPSSRSPGIMPVSILKQPKTLAADQSTELPTSPRSHVLSAIPKHMQLQAGVSVRTPTTVPETRMAPIAKMFVECCNCKFFHDMPSKLYECMAKPDAIVEDKLRGISGAITTMVKCPWCQHNMSRECCAGYAAVVYLKEKLH
ncbi:hypothetical protein C8A03DRAFT_43264 [Achaetomium macrosporum]|uniref:Uncharacterized protein n=1 Tax=Achaetomium macrosporum TaxID=79813 RepID=A0AAN7HEM8_9PEZI|nr:hypothetical protein C8A03DRAFT_43264 [Achaetomium macrosporum]